MRQRRRLLAVPLLAACLSVAGGVTAQPAFADRCAPEEIVLGPDTSPVDEGDNPACTVMFFYVYPFICAPAGSPPNTLLGEDSCASNIALNPLYQPPLLPPYQPNLGRLVCNLILFANPNATCTFAGDAATGGTSISSSFGDLVIPAHPHEGEQ